MKQDNKPTFVKRSLMVTGEDYAHLLQALKERFRKSQIKAAVLEKLRECENDESASLLMPYLFLNK